jgi:hypothetical protein
MQIEASKVTVTPKEHAMVNFAAQALKAGGAAGNVVGVASVPVTPALGSEPEKPVKKKKRRGPKQPNPLSIKKKKRCEPVGSEAPKKKRRRKVKKGDSFVHRETDE